MMADTTKLAASFRAWKLTIGVHPNNLQLALTHCQSLGLLPNVCGFQNGDVLFRVLLPEWSKTAFDSELQHFDGAVNHGVKTTLICPLPSV